LRFRSARKFVVTASLEAARPVGLDGKIVLERYGELSANHRVQDSESKTLSGYSRRVGKERPIDRG